MALLPIWRGGRRGNDRAQVKAIYEGVCDVAIINNYYFGKLTADDDPEKNVPGRLP